MRSMLRQPDSRDGACGIYPDRVDQMLFSPMSLSLYPLHGRIRIQGRNGAFVFDLILPGKNADFKTAVENLFPETYYSLINTQHKSNLRLKLPVFKIEDNSNRYTD